MSNKPDNAAGKMSINELFNYAAELEDKLHHSEQRAKLFSDEAQAARLQLALTKATVNALEDANVELCLVLERHLEAIIAMIDAGTFTAMGQEEFLTIARMARYMLSNVLANFRKVYMQTDTPVPSAPDWTDIPF